MMTKGDVSPGIFMAHVVQHRSPCREHFILTLRVEDFPCAHPGQFVQVLCREPSPSVQRAESQFGTSQDNSKRMNEWRSYPREQQTMLRRPFSIGDLRRDGNACEIDLVGRVVGAGTAWLDTRRKDNVIDILGPLGHGFTSPKNNAHVLLVAGGVGIPPILWWGQTLRQNGIHCNAIYGVQRRDLLPLTVVGQPANTGEFTPCLKEFAECGITSIITTDDGSCGMRGRVTDALATFLQHHETKTLLYVYACGPDPMLRAVSAMCTAHQVRCEVALERVMGCGMGTCQSCVVPVRDDRAEDRWRYALCCTEGPVFDAQRVLWE